MEWGIVVHVLAVILVDVAMGVVRAFGGQGQ